MESRIDEYSQFEKLPRTFYERSDVVQIAQELLGKYLFTCIDGQLTAGKIVETEAYNGRNDKACHAFLKRTKRTEIMYGEGGRAYIYLCYGIHHLFNIVTNRKNMADAILVRGLEPVVGVDIMRTRRGAVAYNKISAGPGTLSQALAIHKKYSGEDLLSDRIWITEGDDQPFEMETDVRIGIDYAEEDAFLPWRFYIRDNPFVSIQKRKSPEV